MLHESCHLVSCAETQHRLGLGFGLLWDRIVELRACEMLLVLTCVGIFCFGIFWFGVFCFGIAAAVGYVLEDWSLGIISSVCRLG